MKAQGTLSRGEGTGHLLERFPGSPGKRDSTTGFLRAQRISQGEREREKNRHGDPSSNGAKVL